MTAQIGECGCGRTALLIDGMCEKCRIVPYDELYTKYRESQVKNPPPPQESLGTLYEGQCLCCSERHPNLIHGACKRCRDLLGNGCGRIARQIRSSPEFSQKIIDSLQGKHKEAFIAIFGLPVVGCDKNSQ
jgi:hypothetical protein